MVHRIQEWSSSMLCECSEYMQYMYASCMNKPLQCTIRAAAGVTGMAGTAMAVPVFTYSSVHRWLLSMQLIIWKYVTNMWCTELEMYPPRIWTWNWTWGKLSVLGPTWGRTIPQELAPGSIMCRTLLRSVISDTLLQTLFHYSRSSVMVAVVCAVHFRAMESFLKKMDRPPLPQEELRSFVSLADNVDNLVTVGVQSNRHSKSPKMRDYFRRMGYVLEAPMASFSLSHIPNILLSTPVLDRVDKPDFTEESSDLCMGEIIGTGA